MFTTISLNSLNSFSDPILVSTLYMEFSCFLSVQKNKWSHRKVFFLLFFHIFKDVFVFDEGVLLIHMNIIL